MPRRDLSIPKDRDELRFNHSAKNIGSRDDAKELAFFTDDRNTNDILLGYLGNDGVKLFVFAHAVEYGQPAVHTGQQLQSQITANGPRRRSGHTTIHHIT